MDGDFGDLGAMPPTGVDEADYRRLAAAIDEDELVELALTLGNIPSISRHEAAAADFVFDWLDKEGFSPRKVGATPSRPNVIGTYGGRATGAGRAAHRGD